MSDWQPIETAPKDGTTILLAIEPISTNDLAVWRGEQKVQVAVGWWSHGGWGTDLMMDGGRDSEGVSGDWPATVRPTHWMPLPEPPRKG